MAVLGKFGDVVRKAHAFIAASVEAHTSVKTNTIAELTAGSGVTVDGMLIKDSQVQGTAPVKADTIAEMTSGSGVTPDGVKLKDGEVYHAVAGLYNGMRFAGASKPPTMIEFMEDFIDTATPKATTTGGKFDVAANTQAWFVTEVDGGTGQTETVIGIPIDGAAGASAHGGWGAFTTCNANNDKLNVQLNGETFKLATGKKLWFETKLAVDDISITELFIGLAISTTDAYGTAGAGDTGGHVGFVSKADGSIVFNVMESGGTLSATDTAKDFVDGSITTFETTNVVHTLGFYWDGVDTITPYVDGVAITAAAVTDAVGSEIPDGVCMSPVFCILTNTTSSATIWLDYIYVAQER